MEHKSSFPWPLLLHRRGLLPSFLQAAKRAAASFLMTVLAAMLFVPSALAQSSTNISVFQYAIFYNDFNGLLEFTTCAPLTINGRVHVNGNIYTGSGSPLIFNGLVTCVGNITSPAWNGQTTNYTYTGTFNGSPSPGYITNAPALMLLIGTNNLHAIIDMPTSPDWNTALGLQQLYNEANVIILVSNSMVYTNNMTSTNFARYTSNTIVSVTLQAGQNGLIAASDDSPVVFVFTNNAAVTNRVYNIATNLPFLRLTNAFIDMREGDQVLATEVDVGKFSTWLTSTSTNAINNALRTKFTGGIYPTILYVADNRTVVSTQFTALRLTNGAALPTNGNFGFTVATPNPLYVIGTYNCPVSAYIGSSNTTAAGAVPAALMSDALTLLSSSWNDTNSGYATTSTVDKRVVASGTTNQVNAAILTGTVPSTGSSGSQFSGGVHNLPRLLEDWSGAKLALNTSFVNLFNSQIATNMFRNPYGFNPTPSNPYYIAPQSRLFYYDLNFVNPRWQPPGAPLLASLGIVTQPQSQTVTASQNVTFTVLAAGYPYVNCQWRFNGTNIPSTMGVTPYSFTNNYDSLDFLTILTSTLTLTNASLATAGTYSVVVSNTLLSLTSSDATLTVTGAPPTISMQPTNQTALVGDTAIFSVTAGGFSPLSYQWKFNGTNLHWATNTSLTLSNVQVSQAGNYAVQVTNTFGSITSSNAVLSVYSSAAATLNPPMISEGNPIQFGVAGVPGFNYAVQASTNLFDWDWLITNSSPFSFVDTNAASFPQRFYRTIYLP